MLKSQIVEHKKWCAENAKHFYEFVLTKKEQLRKELEQFFSTGKVEDTIKKLQVSWEDLRSCFEARDGHTVSDTCVIFEEVFAAFYPLQMLFN